MEKHYRHIIWDWNGTLLDDAWLCVDIMDRMLRARGMGRLTLERYQELFDFPVIDYYRRLGFDFEKEPFEASGTEFIETYEQRRNEISLQVGVVETLEKIQQNGITQSVLSAYRHKTLEELTASLGVRNYFQRVVGLDNHYAFGKVENGKMWLAEMSHEPHEVLLVGDTVHDHEVAIAMNVDCLLIPSGHHTEEKLSHCGAPLLGSVRDVADLVMMEEVEA